MTYHLQYFGEINEKKEEIHFVTFSQHWEAAIERYCAHHSQTRVSQIQTKCLLTRMKGKEWGKSDGPRFNGLLGKEICKHKLTNTQKDKNTLMQKIPKHRNEEQGVRKARRRLFQWVVYIFAEFWITEYRTRSKLRSLSNLLSWLILNKVSFYRWLMMIRCNTPLIWLVKAVETKHFFAVTLKWKPNLVFILLLYMRKSRPDESQSLEMSARFHSNLAAFRKDDWPFL